MKITAIYATERKGVSTTYILAQKAINELRDDDKVYEFFLPKDMNHFCRGCYQCFEGYPEKCGGYEKIHAIRDAMNKSDLIIFTAPVYVFHIPGQLKALLDHFACEWMVHRPNGKMFTKQALIITTAAGGGMRSTIRDIKDSMNFWGVGRLYTYSSATWHPRKPEMTGKVTEEMEGAILKICRKIRKRAAHVKPRLKVKLLFYTYGRLLHKMTPESIDSMYWKEQGWLDKVRPWK